MLFTSYQLQVQPGRNLAPDLEGSGIILGDIRKPKQPQNAIFLPVKEEKLQRIPQGVQRELTLGANNGKIYIERREDSRLFLILSSRLAADEGRGALYALKDQVPEILERAKIVNPYRLSNRWGEIVVQAKPCDAFFATWKVSGEIVRNRLYYVDERMQVHSIEQEQAYLQFKANQTVVPFRLNTRNGHSAARLVMSEWYKIL